MKSNIHFLLLVPATIIFSSCWDFTNVHEAPEFLCDPAFVDCGPVGQVQFGFDPSAFKSRCFCTCADENSIRISRGAGQTDICLCVNGSCAEGFERVQDNCECYPKFNIAKPNYPSSHKSNTFENDYFPLAEDYFWVYQNIDPETEEVIGQWGQLITGSTEVYMLNDSTGMAVPRSWYFQSIILFDSMGMAFDTILGPTFYTSAENDAFVVAQTADDTTIVGFHQVALGDSIGNEEEGFVYFDNIGMVTVPAGSFDNCLLLSADHMDGNVFAPNVGLIKVTSQGQDILVLSEFNGEPNDQDCDEILILSDPITDNSDYQASDHIIISSDVQGSYELTLQAANYIQLNPGFSAPLGSVVTALIAVCENL